MKSDGTDIIQLQDLSEDQCLHDLNILSFRNNAGHLLELSNMKFENGDKIENDIDDEFSRAY